MKIVALPEVRKYLKELIQILYEKEYFGFEAYAQKYVEDLNFFNIVSLNFHSLSKAVAKVQRFFISANDPHTFFDLFFSFIYKHLIFNRMQKRKIISQQSSHSFSYLII